MGHLNVEIKACCENLASVRNALEERNADFRGVDRQTDTYFNTRRGRLKLREGNIENSLIHYRRDNKSGPKDSHVTLYHPEPGSSLKELLADSLGVLAVVEKEREIYFIGNVKFHLDKVSGLGTFLEIEAIDKTGEIGREKLLEQCEEYMTLFKIKAEDLIDCSYSDMIIELKG